ncbi:tetraacyldisaccharide 4'-kinase [Flammeovirga sp. EKP202]|uniref:tetraacyldisaccharide 4'-kinase n=1 Tax=Flammeovirga sp. EKP202 TaxID=2770592 RepID=UPI00165F9EFB|nr:tetraacyldisaccharide 4'-kinase [Flammeovirga sp. EKP202]MBD0402214.1 tetraacyldisaccharide 4'-kinase [Flammeovirga sp. EKP202]
MKYILKPFSRLYDYITSVRNQGYDKGRSRIVSFSLPIICVGNLSVGGTGKTPFVEFLIQNLSDKYKVGILSRGYGRKTKGPIYADEIATARTIGDEPMQYHSKYQNIEVVVAEQRVLGVPFFADSDIIVLDDAFQHRAIHRDLNIMLSDFSAPFFKDEVLPLGRLRERREGASRADVIIYTKVKHQLSQKEIELYTQSTHQYAPNAQVFFTSIKYGELYPLNENSKNGLEAKEVFVMTSIAKPEPMLEYIEGNLQRKVVKHFKFRDHYSFTEKTIQRIEKEIGEQKTIIISEKDAVKLRPLLRNTSLQFIVIPILPEVLNNQKDQLLALIESALSKAE